MVHLYSVRCQIQPGATHSSLKKIPLILIELNRALFLDWYQQYSSLACTSKRLNMLNYIKTFGSSSILSKKSNKIELYMKHFSSTGIKIDMQ